MQFEYPLYLIPLETGYVSVVESNTETESQAEKNHTYYLAVFTGHDRAEGFMETYGLEGSPQPLHNGREVAWAAQSLREPVNNMAFDPSSESATTDSEHVEANWKVSVQELLDNHIVVDYSPWNYPVFLIEQQDGYASVEGRASTGEEMRAVGLFTTREKAEKFLQNADETGHIRSLDTMQQAREFLESLLPDVVAVALDLTVDHNQRSAEYCFSVRTVLDKYLVEQQR